MRTELNCRQWGPGYRLQDWVTVDSGTRSPARLSAQIPKETVPDETPADPVTGSLNDRQRWAIGQLNQGLKLQIRHIVAHFGCSNATAKRDLTGLKSLKLVRFVGSARAGHYCSTGREMSLPRHETSLFMRNRMNRLE